MSSNATLYKCYYCGKQYSKPEEVLLCQAKHESLIRENNTEGLNRFIISSMLDLGEISDGENSFKDLYHDKATLVVALFALLSRNGVDEIWYSDFFSDGSIRPGYFLVGLNYNPDEQLTYLLPIEYKAEIALFALGLEKAPPFKGHSSEDVRKRLYKQVIKLRTG